MSTIVRVKRPRQESAVESLLLSCKRMKTDSSCSHQTFEKIFNYSGTVQVKDDEIAAKVAKSFNKRSENSSPSPKFRSEQRAENQERRNQNRLRLLSCLRSNKEDGNLEVGASDNPKENFTIVDVSHESDEENYVPSNFCVYDIYSTKECDSDFDDLYIENLLSVQPLGSEIEIQDSGCFLDFFDDDSDNKDDDEDDSNDENNWRNDYPDSEDGWDEDKYAKMVRRLLVFNDDSVNDYDDYFDNADRSDLDTSEEEDEKEVEEEEEEDEEEEEEAKEEE